MTSKKLLLLVTIGVLVTALAVGFYERVLQATAPAAGQADRAPSPRTVATTSTVRSRSEGATPVRSGATSAPSRYAAQVMADRPLAYWRFHEISGTSAHSETGNYDGIVLGSPTFGAVGPVEGGKAITLDGADDRMTADALSRLPVSTWANGFTLEAWANTTSDRTEQHVMEFAQGDGNQAPAILFDDPTWAFKYRDGTISSNTSTTGALSNTWYYLVATVDAQGNGQLFMNGIPEAGWSGSAKPPTDGLFQIGADYDCHPPDSCPTLDTFFHGKIAEPAIYNKVLSADRIQAHYTAR
jgi:large repetitive protein